MIEILNSENRGKSTIDWLKSYHSFSFSEYYNPQYMHFSNLRVLNEDFIAPKSGFPMHSHQDMEIITYIISGELTHKDSLGSAESIKPGEIQLMRAGTGITHSEFNQDIDVPVHLLQIWIFPRQKGLQPSYQQKNFNTSIKPNSLNKIISPIKSENTLHIEQDVDIYSAKLENDIIEYTISQNHKIWIQVVSGNMHILGKTLSSGDGAGITNENQLKISSDNECEFLLFDFAK